MLRCRTPCNEHHTATGSVVDTVQVAIGSSNMKLLISWMTFCFHDLLNSPSDKLLEAAVKLHDEALLVLFYLWAVS